MTRTSMDHTGMSLSHRYPLNVFLIWLSDMKAAGRLEMCEMWSGRGRVADESGV